MYYSKKNELRNHQLLNGKQQIGKLNYVYKISSHANAFRAVEPRIEYTLPSQRTY